MMKVIILILLLILALMGIAVLKALKTIAQEESDFATAMFPVFSLAQSAQCNQAMEIEKTKNHRYDSITPYNKQLMQGIDSLNKYKLSNQTSISKQYEEGQNG